jgi:predicted aminopeptidase
MCHRYVPGKYTWEMSLEISVREYCMRGVFTICLMLLSGCADLGYYWHSASGHLGVMNKRVDIEDLIDQETTDSTLAERLRLVQKIRLFSIEQLKLPDNDSYRSYVELEKPYVLQNLFAASEFSTGLYRWCYPIIGCASYRGYYDDERMQTYIEQLKSDGYEVHVGQVSAYSTLGWFDDPVLSSFINWPDYRLAGLLFHELTHQQVYIDDDTTFNESLASAVQQAGTELWLIEQKQSDQLDGFHRWLKYRGQVIELIVSTQQNLNQIYSSGVSDADKRTAKQQAFLQAREEHSSIAALHSVSGGFSKWFAGDLNNAKFGSVAAYNSQVPAFLAILDYHERQFEPFYRYIDRLSQLDKTSRDSCLENWLAENQPSGSCPAGSKSN